MIDLSMPSNAELQELRKKAHALFNGGYISECVDGVEILIRYECFIKTENKATDIQLVFTTIRIKDPDAKTLEQKLKYLVSSLLGYSCFKESIDVQKQNKNKFDKISDKIRKLFLDKYNDNIVKEVRQFLDDYTNKYKDFDIYAFLKVVFDNERIIIVNSN